MLMNFIMYLINKYFGLGCYYYSIVIGIMDIGCRKAIYSFAKTINTTKYYTRRIGTKLHYNKSMFCRSKVLFERRRLEEYCIIEIIAKILKTALLAR